jgi:hypothetical protein
MKSRPKRGDIKPEKRGSGANSEIKAERCEIKAERNEFNVERGEIKAEKSGK